MNGSGRVQEVRKALPALVLVVLVRGRGDVVRALAVAAPVLPLLPAGQLERKGKLPGLAKGEEVLGAPARAAVAKPVACSRQRADKDRTQSGQRADTER